MGKNKSNEKRMSRKEVSNLGWSWLQDFENEELDIEIFKKERL